MSKNDQLEKRNSDLSNIKLRNIKSPSFFKKNNDGKDDDDISSVSYISHTKSKTISPQKRLKSRVDENSSDSSISRKSVVRNGKVQIFEGRLDTSDAEKSQRSINPKDDIKEGFKIKIPTNIEVNNDEDDNSLSQGSPQSKISVRSNI